MPCEMFPLGYHLSLSVKEKIWKGEFIDILSLLPFNVDFMVRTDERGKRGARRTGESQYPSHLTIGCRHIVSILA